MKRNLQMLAVPATIAASLLLGCSGPEITGRAPQTRPSIVQVQEGYDTLGRNWGDQTNPNIISRNEFTLQKFAGTITDIDYSTREVTLKDSQGRLQTFVMDKSVQRFNEAKVGDKVSVDYYQGLNAEVRKPTAEEAQNPLVVTEATGRAAPDAAPAGNATRQIRAVVTIEGLDRQSQTLTVKDSRGKYFVTRVADPSRLEQVHIGDTIVLTFTEATAISLNPA
jgi:hypothetical protein